MKKITLIVTISFLIAILITSCNDTLKKDIYDANNNLKEANQDLKEALITINDTIKKNAIANWKSFRSESEYAIALLDKNVATLEAKLAKANDVAKEKLKTDLEKINKKLAPIKVRLQKKNTEFENNINKFDKKVASNNQSFQNEFNKDINKLSSALKDLSRDNIK